MFPLQLPPKTLRSTPTTLRLSDRGSVTTTRKVLPNLWQGSAPTYATQPSSPSRRIPRATIPSTDYAQRAPPRSCARAYLHNRSTRTPSCAPEPRATCGRGATVRLSGQRTDPYRATSTVERSGTFTLTEPAGLWTTASWSRSARKLP